MLSSHVCIAPSLLSADFSKLASEVRSVEQAGADWIHIDVMDGLFVPPLTVGPVVVEAIRRVTSLTLDVHLMVADPERYVGPFAAAGADRISVHGESTPHVHRVLSQIRALGKAAGLVLNPSTCESSLTYLLGLLDQVVLMSVNPGYSGQTFLPEVLPKIASVRKILDASGYPIALVVDGGVHTGTIGSVVSAGAGVVVAGKAIFGTEDYRQAIVALRHAATEGFPLL